MYHPHALVDQKVLKLLAYIFEYMTKLYETCTEYCKLVIIRHVPIFAIFVSTLNDEFMY